MAQHFIHYVPRRIILRFPDNPSHPWFAEAQVPSAGFDQPLFHTSHRKTGPTQQIREGDTLWIIGQIFSPWGVLAPGLDATIEVERVERAGDGKLRFVASEQSRWYALSDVTRVLPLLRTVTAAGQSNPLHQNDVAPIGQCLQSIRQLESAAPLQLYVEQLRRQPLNFISYRICDGTRAAFEKTKALMGAGQPVFWDRWCLPRRLAERRELVSHDALDQYLMKRMASAALVWGIESPAYSIPGSYSEKEKHQAMQLGIYQPVPCWPA
ncbi:hypothetical protein D3C76_972970 [compost metagenome]|uniref:hypothetical protein n=1 Tax=Pseudomonas putida TaxID=303 RepID=UPI000F9B8EBC